MDVNMPQCYITSGINEPMTGSNVVYKERTIAEFGENLVFEPIP